MVATPPALVPNAIAFRDPNHGLLGARGTISASADGGRTWRVVLRTPRAVVRVGFRGRSEWAELADGRTLASDDGRTWRRGAARRPLPLPCRSPLPGGVPSVRAGRSLWAVCLGGAGAGAMAKAVYRSDDGGRRWRVLAAANFDDLAPRSRGGIALDGYPVGIAMAADGFGLIWESRGTLWLTRDGGSGWHGLPRVARPEEDFGLSGSALRGGIGFVLLSTGSSGPRRLLETPDFGRTWRVVHRWG